MSRFFVEPSAVEGKYIVLEDRDDLHHMKKVLRLSIGDELDVSDGNAWEYRVRIADLTDRSAQLEILDKQKFAREPEVQVTLFQGIPKASKMEGIIQKTVELGVHAIVPVWMARTVVVDKGNFGKKLDRWQKISDEAVKQCKRGIIPQVEEGLKFSQMMDRLGAFDLVLFPYENEENRTIKDCLRQLTTDAGACSGGDSRAGAGSGGVCNAGAGSADGCVSAESGGAGSADGYAVNGPAAAGPACGSRPLPRTVAIIIGPEGGFSDQEAAMLKEAGAACVSLGRTILRTETAGPAALAMTMYELEL